MQSQLFADERWLKDGFFPTETAGFMRLFWVVVEVAKEFGYNVLNVLGLPECGRAEVFFAVKVVASAVFQRLVFEVLLKSFLPKIASVAVDDVVKCGAGKVTQEDSLTVCGRQHGVDEVGKRVMSVVCKAAGDAADVEKKVGFIDN